MSKLHSHPIVFMFLFLPFGILSGYTNVTIAFLFTNSGIPLEAVAPFVAVGLVPNIIKFLWAPLIDTTLSVKKWYLLSDVITGIGIVLMTIFALTSANVLLLTVINFIASFANTFLAMSTESLMAYDTPEHLKGRAGGWLQAGNLGGLGLGGGAGLWLAEKLPALWMSGVIIGAVCVLCAFALLFLTEPQITIRAEKYLMTLRNLNKDIWNVVKSRKGSLGLLLCFLPIGTGAASNLWSAVSKDWHASADTVALIVGVLGGVLSAIGCLAGGWICDQIDKKRAYILFGVIQAVCTVAMAYTPHTESLFITWCSIYAVSSGLSYAGFTAFTLEAIGKGAAATKYNVFASLSNAPIYYMIYMEEWAHIKWGIIGMLNIEAVMALLGIITFITIFVAVNKMKPELA